MITISNKYRRRRKSKVFSLEILILLIWTNVTWTDVVVTVVICCICSHVVGGGGWVMVVDGWVGGGVQTHFSYQS